MNPTPSNPNKRIRLDDNQRPGLKKSDFEKLYFDSYAGLAIHEDMIRDHSRTNTYRNAMIQNPSDFKDAIVLDVGCGTGILSIFAIQAGAKHVYAIDASDIAKVATQLVSYNNLSDRITVIQGKIEEINLPVEKVDIIISEWMGYFLIYESMLESVFYARDHWLKQDGKMYPSSANIFIEGFSHQDLYSEKVDFWNKMYGIDFAPVREHAIKVSFIEPQVEYIKPEEELSFPINILSIDCKNDSFEKLKSFVGNFEFQPILTAQMNGIMGYFTVEFNGKDKKLTLSTSPTETDTHWYQTLFFFDEPVPVDQNTKIKGSLSDLNNMNIIEASNPTYSKEEASLLIKSYFDVVGDLTLSSLPSYDDQNFKVTSSTGEKYVLKISNISEDENLLDCQSKAMALLFENSLSCPKPFPTKEGNLFLKTPKGNLVRLLAYLPGTVYGELKEISNQCLENMGGEIAKMNVILTNQFQHSGAFRNHVWDLKNASQLRNLLSYIKDEKHYQIAHYYLSLFEVIEPKFEKLRKSVIHGDANDFNLLVDNEKISGIIDWGDICFTNTIFELAILTAYCILYFDNPFDAACHVIKGWNNVFPLLPEEIEVLFPLICARTTVSVLMSTKRQTEEPYNQYIPISQKIGWKMLNYMYTNVTPNMAYLKFKEFCSEAKVPQLNKAELVEWRKSHLGKSLSLSYDIPLHILRDSLMFTNSPFTLLLGSGQCLYDEDGTEYLDGVNNVCHVGHCHPRVVEAAHQQTTTLCTNTRYLSSDIVEYINSLLKTFPPSLSVCYLVCSGTEANELALRLARSHTKRKDVIVVEGGYHGNSNSLVEISPYKFQGKGGFPCPEIVHAASFALLELYSFLFSMMFSFFSLFVNTISLGKGGFPCPDFVHVIDCPDGYRGKYLYDDPEAAKKYSDQVKEILEKNPEKIGAFFCESIIGCGGQILPPKDYFKYIYELIKANGGVCIADEVQVGFGRVGTSFWGFNCQDDVTPDIVTMGKPIGNGHPIGAEQVVFQFLVSLLFLRGTNNFYEILSYHKRNRRFVFKWNGTFHYILCFFLIYLFQANSSFFVTTKEIADSFSNGMEYFNTFGGNNVSCRIGKAVLDVIKSEKLQENALFLGNFLIRELNKLKERYPIIGDVRGKGLFLGIEFISDPKNKTPAKEQTHFIIQYLKNKSKILLSIDGPFHNIIKIKPPLCWTLKDAKRLIRELENAILEEQKK